ncbi:4Fe-4S single cluster domain-containing protein [Lentzea sp. BCCO 10_0798]|uniref:4Fe-4S single cluster domain-containing protein n=1 Tax=Lentzea kristufekii TaxID=3095430 RepID=A0ABU4TN78_9PSEU|nr:4Fe-4S single cluster domain-containing protein [Lentzea sp. BCCO 10_0798]MDX8049714.1 4Fe-4S single cluster domain-containing protein [Lentzea sp. BCCO 10_0798]
MLRTSRVLHPITALGPGRRLGIWLQGCTLACKGCMSLDTWEPGAGTGVGLDHLRSLWQEAVRAGVDGLTVSGGEPLQQATALREFLASLSLEGRDVLLYTGYELGELDDEQLGVLDHVDAVITGRYVAGAQPGLIWRGSANQRLIPLTPLGEQRYRPFVELATGRAQVQVRVDDGLLWLVGVPPPGVLPKVERRLRDNGIVFEEAAWRP